MICNDFLTLTKAKSTLVRSEVVKLLRPSLGLLRGPELLRVPMWKVGERSNQVDNLLSAIWNSWFNQISQVATGGMRGVALNGHFYQLSHHKQYLTISQIKGRNRHWAKKKSIPLANQNIFSVSFSIHPAICLPEKLTCRYPPCLVIVSLKKASFYALGQASSSLFAFSSILSKGRRRGPRIEKQKLKRLPLEYDIKSCHTRLLALKLA